MCVQGRLWQLAQGYPYAVVTEKQKRAMEQANVGYVCHSIYDLAFACAQKLLT